MLAVSILTTGHEVLRGHTLNTNAAWLGRRATEAGARVVAVRTVGDDPAELVRLLREALAEADLVLVTGGLGPTEDDRTRDALAEVLGVDLVHDEAVWRSIQAWFSRAERPPLPMQRRQALVPPGARVLENLEGTAPGLQARVGAREVYCLPGPPREMAAMFDREVLPRWIEQGRLEEVASRVVWTAGVPESEVAAPIAALMRSEEPVVGTHPDEGEVCVRVLARGAGASARAEAVVETVRRALGPAVVSTQEHHRVQHALVAALAGRRLVLTTAESVSGGLVARKVCEVPGASAVFRGGWVTYSDAWKAAALGVPRTLLLASGAVSEAVVRAMAEGACAAASADVAIATTGVAGPGPSAEGVEAGTAFVAVAVRGGATRCRALRIPLPRGAVQQRIAIAALDLARRCVGELPGEDSNLD